MSLGAVAVIALSLVLSGPPQTVSPEEDLREAARLGDLVRVRFLLDSGVAVDAPNRYQATPLFFAADRGHIDIVRLLVERGASVNVEDTFYRNTIIGQALGGGHYDIARYLLEHGAEGADRALTVAARTGERGLFDAALATESVHAAAIETAMTSARNRSDDYMLGRLASTTPAPDAAPAIDPATFPNFVGTYRNDAQRQGLEVTLANGVLSVKVADQPSRTLTPVAPSAFVATDDVDFRVSFAGRGGMIERLVLATSGRSMDYRPLGETEGRDAPPAGEGDVIAATSIDEAPRTTPMPWASFRGPNATGIADGQGAPVEWNVSTGSNVLWKRPIPGFANAAPIIWDDSVFVTTAVSSESNETIRTGLYGSTTPAEDMSEHSWRIYSLDRSTGNIVWERTVYTGEPKTKRHTKASQANSTPVTDGEHLVAVFGSIGLMVCYDFDGNLIWKKDIGALQSGWFYDPDYQWGHSSSPIIYKGMVIIQVDMPANSYIAAYGVATGEQVWRTERADEISTFGTPAVYSGPTGEELITNGTRYRSYNPANGELLWSLGPNSEIPIPTPIISGDRIFLTAGYPPIRPIYVIRPGHRGDLSLAEGLKESQAVVWSANRGGIYIPTPIVYDGYFYTTAENGRLTCYDAATGEIVYQVRIGGVGGSYAASPIAADGKLYFASEDGDVYVVRAGPRYELLAKNSMNEIIMANPAVSNGVMVIRTIHHVYGVGSTTQE